VLAAPLVMTYALRRRRLPGQNCIVLSTHDFDLFPCAADDMIDFALGREVGSICLDHTRLRQGLLSTFVAPFPCLRGPLHEIRTYSRDRYGAVLAPRALRAHMVTASGDRLLKRIDVDAYFAQLDQGAEGGFWNSIIWLLRKRVPLAHRVEQLRRAGLLSVPDPPHAFAITRPFSRSHDDADQRDDLHQADQ
jgi:hypothetical protein